MSTRFDMHAAGSEASGNHNVRPAATRVLRSRPALRHLAWRTAGVAAIAGAAGVSLIHRQVLVEDIKGPANASEILLSLLCFLLASLGVMLLLQGARLRDGWARNLPRTPAETAGDAAGGGPRHDVTALDAIAADCLAPPGSRAAIAMFLADRALRNAARGPTPPAPPPETHPTGHAS